MRWRITDKGEKEFYRLADRESLNESQEDLFKVLERATYAEPIEGELSNNSIRKALKLDFIEPDTRTLDQIVIGLGRHSQKLRDILSTFVGLAREEKVSEGEVDKALIQFRELELEKDWGYSGGYIPPKH